MNIHVGEEERLIDLAKREIIADFSPIFIYFYRAFGLGTSSGLTLN